MGRAIWRFQPLLEARINSSKLPVVKIKIIKKPLFQEGLFYLGDRIDSQLFLLRDEKARLGEKCL